MRVDLTLPEDFPAPPTAALSLGKITKVGGCVRLISTSARPRPTGGMTCVTFCGSAVSWKTLGGVVVGLHVRLDQCVVVVVVMGVVVVFTAAAVDVVVGEESVADVEEVS